MSVTGSWVQVQLHNYMVELVALCCMWSLGVGIVLVSDATVIADETAWKSASFDHHFPLPVYGVVLICASILMGVSAKEAQLWRTGRFATVLAFVVCLFLAFMLIIQAAQTGAGWIGALCFVFVAGILGIVYRMVRREHPFGGG